MGKEIVRVTVRIPRDVHTQISQLAVQGDRSLNWQIVQAMRVGVEQLTHCPQAETKAELGDDTERI